MKIGDGLIGIVICIFSIYIYGVSTTFPQQNSYFSPRLFPSIISMGLFVLGLVLLGRALRKCLSHQASARELFSMISDPETKTKRSVTAIVMIVGSALAYVFLMDIVGFQVLTAVLLFVFYMTLGASWLRSTLTALIATAVIDLVFRSLMNIPLSAGYLESVLY